jgi:hypothetical protein
MSTTSVVTEAMTGPPGVICSTSGFYRIYGKNNSLTADKKNENLQKYLI